MIRMGLGVTCRWAVPDDTRDDCTSLGRVSAKMIREAKVLLAASPAPEYPGWTRGMRVLTKGPWAIIPMHYRAGWFGVWNGGRRFAACDSERGAVEFVADNGHNPQLAPFPDDYDDEVRDGKADEWEARQERET